MAFPEGAGRDPAAAAGAALAEVEARLDAVDEVLARLDEGTHGRCARCGAALDPTRLDDDPLARTCEPACPTATARA